MLFKAIIKLYVSVKIFKNLCCCCLEELMSCDLDEIYGIVEVYLLFVLFTSVHWEWRLLGLPCSEDHSAQIYAIDIFLFRIDFQGSFSSNVGLDYVIKSTVN